eukprot:6290592-Heterocapsa_arctica.AAC.1
MGVCTPGAHARARARTAARVRSVRVPLGAAGFGPVLGVRKAGLMPSAGRMVRRRTASTRATLIATTSCCIRRWNGKFDGITATGDSGPWTPSPGLGEGARLRGD